LIKKGSFTEVTRVETYKWLRILFIKNLKKQSIKWVLSKKYIPLAVVRNRFKRWGRDYLKKKLIKGNFLIVFKKKESDFYKKLRREEFNNVFKITFKKIQKDKRKK